MKNRLCFIFLFLPTLIYSQQSGIILTENAVHPIRNISAADENFSDLEFLKPLLKDKRIVLLGEQTHGDGATFESKVRLIKFLHQQLGYTMLSFESGLYDNYKAFQMVKPGEQQTSALKESILGIWSDTRELESLIDYVHNRKDTDTPLIVTGFDCQEHDYFQDNFLAELDSAVETLDEKDREILEQVIAAGPEFVASSQADSTAFFSMTARIIGSLDKLVAENNSVHNQMLRQTFVSWLAIIQWSIDEIREKEIYVQNPRDLQMARNLIFLANLYPDRKIIAWGASYHFADRLELLEFSDVTKGFVQVADSIQKSAEPTDIENDLKGAVPMGKILKAHFGEALYSISFSSYEGSYGMAGDHTYSLLPLQPPVGSIEKELFQKGIENGFVHYNKASAAKFYSSALGNLPMRAPWQKIFDGHVFIKKSYPPSLLQSLTTAAVKESIAPERYSNTKTNKVVDAKTGEGVAFASIALANSSKGVSSNVLGEFLFNIPDANKNGQVIISSIGYKTVKLSVSELNKLNKIRLTPLAYELDAVEVHAKGLSAREIIKKASKAIKRNYHQAAYQQEVFYRVNEYAKDSLAFSEEAAVMVHDPDGYKPSGNVSKNLKGQILQLRNTTVKHPHNGIWDGVGSLWLMYSHDAILNKDNVVHRPIFYDLELKGVTTLDAKRVYEISFDCRRPGAFTTGYGYPAPESASGTVFIDASTFAVLKFEVLIKRKPHVYKKQPYLSREPYGHKLIQTYQEFDGKYFLKYSKQIMYAQYTDSRTNKKSSGVSIRELLSTEINTTPHGIPIYPIARIKNGSVPHDPKFWQQHNIIIEDDIRQLHREFGIQEK